MVLILLTRKFFMQTISFLKFSMENVSPLVKPVEIE